MRGKHGTAVLGAALTQNKKMKKSIDKEVDL